MRVTVAADRIRDPAEPGEDRRLIIIDDPRGAPQDREKAVIQLAENQALHFRRLVAAIKKGDL